MKQSRRLGIGVAALALVAAACGGGDDLAEAIINSQTDGNVDISNDGQSITFESEDGSGTINTDGDGNITFQGTDEDGGQISITGGGGDIPADFPLPVAPGGTVAFSMSSTEGDLLTISYPADDFDQLAALYTEFMTSTEGEESISNGTVDGSKWFNSWITLADGTYLSASLSQGADETVVSLTTSTTP
jgi:hypothetical protein